MSHLVLARKYRPKFFAEVVGQDLIIATLQAAIEKKRVAHAMLFTGGRGIGKTTIARIVAKALVCLNREGSEPCGLCVQCQAVDDFSSLDVVEIDGASHTGVDDIRDLRDSARYLPTSAKMKIFIIDEVHMLSISAFNALLKILEEPPPHVMFIFATTEAHKIPKTILSRCQRYDFKRVSIETISQTLKNVLAKEDFVIEDDGLRLIATLADGGLRDALSMGEQIIAQGRQQYTAEMVAGVLGVVSHRAVKDICESLLAGSVDRPLDILRDVYEKGLDLCHLMDAIAERFRVLALSAHLDAKKIAAIVPSFDEDDVLAVKKYDKADLKRLFSMALDALAQVSHAQKPLYALELFVLRAALRPPISDAVTINYCLQKLDAIMHNRPLPKEISILAPVPEKAPEALPVVKKEKETRPEAKAIPAVPVAAKDVVNLFRQVLTDLSSTMPALASHLRHAEPTIDISRRIVNLSFTHSLHYEQCLPHRDNKAMKDLIDRIFGGDFRVVFEHMKGEDTAKPLHTVAHADEQKKVEEREALHEEARNHPLVKKALEIFGGDITEITRFESKISS